MRKLAILLFLPLGSFSQIFINDVSNIGITSMDFRMINIVPPTMNTNFNNFNNFDLNPINISTSYRVEFPNMTQVYRYNHIFVNPPQNNFRIEPINFDDIFNNKGYKNTYKIK